MQLTARILVVDDDLAFLETYREILEREGYEVSTVRSAGEAARLLAEGGWDVVLVDQKLRGPEGPDEGIDLLTDAIGSGAKAIVATGFASPEMIERAFSEGAYDYLEKGPNLQTLLRIKIRNAMEAVRERRIGSLDREQREQRIKSLWEAVRTTTEPHRKGAVLEDLLLLLFKSIPGFGRVESRRRSKDEEIDLMIPNESEDPLWRHEGPYFLGECKNWVRRVGPADFDRFRAKVHRKYGRVRLGFFIAPGGFTSGFRSHVLAAREGDVLIVSLDGNDLAAFVESSDRGEFLKRIHQQSTLAGNGET